MIDDFTPTHRWRNLLIEARGWRVTVRNTLGEAIPTAILPKRIWGMINRWVSELPPNEHATFLVLRDYPAPDEGIHFTRLKRHGLGRGVGITILDMRYRHPHDVEYGWLSIPLIVLRFKGYAYQLGRAGEKRLDEEPYICECGQSFSNHPDKSYRFRSRLILSPSLREEVVYCMSCLRKHVYRYTPHTTQRLSGWVVDDV